MSDDLANLTLITATSIRKKKLENDSEEQSFDLQTNIF